jgi:hypothetical protein
MSHAFAIFAFGLVASHATAQVELTGTNVRYVAIDRDGTMVCDRCGTGDHSMQYAEAPADTPSCDLYFPGAPQESFTVEGVVGGGRPVRLTNHGDPTIADELATESGPTISGRSIVWSGTGTLSTTTVRVEQTHSYETADRFVRVSVRITNTGTAAITDLYYLRNGDPDHGSCNIGFDYATINDVRRQPPADSSALATARGGDAASPGRSLVLGIGSFDARARVHNGGFYNTDASGEWNSPSDSGGMLADEAVDIVFREATLAAGASTVFDMIYVWGRTEAEVELRFDELGFPIAPCVGLMEGAACTTAAGATGFCRAGRCCTGCWNGTACQPGTSASSCGAAGGSCASCVDADTCTSDLCARGVCSNPTAPVGTPCEDGMFCTAPDACDATGRCIAGTMLGCDDGLSCTTDACDEAADRCSAALATGCAIDGRCIEEGAGNPESPCLACDSTASTTSWTPLAEGSDCGPAVCAAGARRVSTCDAAGVCVPRPAVRCPTGACADATSCTSPCGPDGCAADEYCDETTMRCEPLRENGAPCAREVVCASGSCADGVCCDAACDGVCVSCDLVAGACTPLPDGTDPDDECATECNGAGECRARADAGAIGSDAGPLPGDAGSAMRDAGTAVVLEDDGCGCGTGSRSSVFSFALVVLAAALRSRLRIRRTGAK